MNHLYLDISRDKSWANVPCLYEHREDDFPPLLRYPGILGWTEADVNNPANWSSDPVFDSYPRKPRREAEVLIQGWLYFGLLRTFFSPDITPVFQKQDLHGQAFVSTEFLPQLLTIQRLRFNNANTEHLKQLLQLLKTYLFTAREVFSVVYKDHSRIDKRIVFSIAVLGRTIEAFISRRRFDRGQDLSDFDTLLPVNRWPMGGNHNGDFVSSKLLDDGWCEQEVRKISLLTPSSQFMVCQMTRPHPELQHMTCDALRCTAYNMDETKYETEHVCESGSCDWLTASNADLREILEGNDVPVVIFLRSRSSGKLEIKLIKASTTRHYVAFSHVWSDRLGNPKSNSMPSCQVQRLASMAAALFPAIKYEVPFWIDTLCCPLEPESATILAIRLMRKTYLDASIVLIVEKCLTQYPVSGTSSLEKLLRLYCSTWATRLWTLQEGFLAKSLYIQFKGRALSFMELFHDLAQSFEHNPELSEGLSDFLSQYAITKIEATSKNPFLASLSYIQRHLIHRQTSCIEDESLCLGTLLGQEVNPLFEGDAKDRMRRFWYMQMEVPSDVIFLRRGVQYKEHGLRWAPQTFMLPSNDRITGLREALDEPACVRTDQGLLVRYPGLFMPDTAEPLILPFFWLKMNGSEQRYLVRCEEWVCRMENGRHSIGNMTSYECVHIPHGGETSQQKHAIILRCPLETLLRSPENKLGGIHFALVSVYAQEGSTYYVQLLTNGMVMLEDRGRFLYPNRSYPVPTSIIESGKEPSELQDRDADSLVVSLEKPEEMLQWCVG